MNGRRMLGTFYECHTSCELGGTVLHGTSVMTEPVQNCLSQVTNFQTHPTRWFPNWDYRGEGFVRNKYWKSIPVLMSLAEAKSRLCIYLAYVQFC